MTVPEFELSNNYLNPFNSTATIHYKIPDNCMVNLTIYDTTGRVIKILRNEYQTAGNYVIQWQGDDHSGRPVSSGVYYYQLKTNDTIQTKKMMLLK